MFKFHEFLIPLLAIAALAVCMLFGLFNMTLGTLLLVCLVAVVFTYVGIMLDRRSKTARLYADTITANIDEVRARTRATLRNAGLY